MALSYFFNHQVGGNHLLLNLIPIVASQSNSYLILMVGLNQTIPGLRVWTSWLKRTIQTSAHINAPQVQISSQTIAYLTHLVKKKVCQSLEYE